MPPSATSSIPSVHTALDSGRWRVPGLGVVRPNQDQLKLIPKGAKEVSRSDDTQPDAPTHRTALRRLDLNGDGRPDVDVYEQFERGTNKQINRWLAVQGSDGVSYTLMDHNMDGRIDTMSRQQGSNLQWIIDRNGDGKVDGEQRTDGKVWKFIEDWNFDGKTDEERIERRAE